MTNQQQLKSLDAMAEGVETLSQNVIDGITNGKSGWFGARIKLTGGRVAVVQVTTDVEITGATESRKRPNRA